MPKGTLMRIVRPAETDTRRGDSGWKAGINAMIRGEHKAHPAPGTATLRSSTSCQHGVAREHDWPELDPYSAFLGPVGALGQA